MKDTNFIVIQGWMITRLGLRGNALIIYALLYSLGQGQSGFQGSDLDLKEYLAPIIPRSSFYKALTDLLRQNRIKSDGVWISAILPPDIRPDNESKSETAPSKSETAASKNETDSLNNINKIKNNPQKKSEFYDSNELLRRLRGE